MLLVGGILLFAIILAVLIFVPKWQAGTFTDSESNNERVINRFTNSERFRMEDEARKTLAQIIGGIFVLIGLIVTFNAYQVSVQKQDLDRDAQMTDRFSKAITHLSDEKLVVRIGGLFELERIAIDSPKDAPTTKQLIYAYLHNNFSNSKSDSSKPAKASVVRKNSNGLSIENFQSPSELQTIINVIQSISDDLERLDMRSLDLSDRNLARGKYIYANFSNTDLTGAILFASDFKGADFRKSNLSRASTDIAEHVEIGRSLVTLITPEAARAIFSQADFEDANLTDADLTASICKGAKFRNAILRSAILYKVDLSDADFSNSDATDSNFGQADLSRASFVRANLKGAALERAKLDLANFSDCDLSEVTGLTYDNLKLAIISERTILPAPFEPNRSELLAFSKENAKLLHNQVLNETLGK